jgi:hypothetical protein
LADEFDWADVTISLRLKNVTASEIFNAMNLVFETAKTPLRWDMGMNGNRPTAVLRFLGNQPSVGIDPATGLPAPTGLPAFPPAPPEKPMVFFVGDLVGDPKSGGMSMDQLVQTVYEVCNFAQGKINISSHKQAQLIVVRGTEEDIQFVQSTLAALREKVRMDEERRAQTKDTEPKVTTSETKTR